MVSIVQFAFISKFLRILVLFIYWLYFKCGVQNDHRKIYICRLWLEIKSQLFSNNFIARQGFQLTISLWHFSNAHKLNLFLIFKRFTDTLILAGTCFSKSKIKCFRIHAKYISIAFRLSYQFRKCTFSFNWNYFYHNFIFKCMICVIGWL